MLQVGGRGYWSALIMSFSSGHFWQLPACWKPGTRPGSLCKFSSLRHCYYGLNWDTSNFKLKSTCVSALTRGTDKHTQSCGNSGVGSRARLQHSLRVMVGCSKLYIAFLPNFWPFILNLCLVSTRLCSRTLGIASFAELLLPRLDSGFMLPFILRLA
jgi:hypothetical protein